MSGSRDSKSMIRKGSIDGHMLTDEQLSELIDKSTITLSLIPSNTFDKKININGKENKQNHHQSGNKR